MINEEFNNTEIVIPNISVGTTRFALEKGVFRADRANCNRSGFDYEHLPRLQKYVGLAVGATRNLRFMDCFGDFDVMKSNGNRLEMIEFDDRFIVKVNRAFGHETNKEVTISVKEAECLYQWLGFQLGKKQLKEEKEEAERIKAENIKAIEAEIEEQKEYIEAHKENIAEYEAQIEKIKCEV